MIPIKDVLRQETKCHGTLNGIRFELVGGGFGRPFDGVVRTDIKSATGPLHFPPALLAPVLIMGYPTFSTYHPGAFDLFKLSDGYTYTRAFHFQNGGRITTEHYGDYCGDHLKGDFQVVDGNIDIPDIVACEPTIEAFMPAGLGRVKSQFWMGWHTRSGEIFNTVVESEYRLTHNAGLPYAQFRYITFDGVYEAERIQQTERLNVFRDLRKLFFPDGQAEAP